MSSKQTKRAKVSHGNQAMHNEYFKDIENIPYKPTAGPEETLVFKHYDANEVVHGRSMEDWLRFSVCYWHTFRGTGLDPFGAPTLSREWDDGSDTIENAKRRMTVAFELMHKLGVKYWTFHDRDIAPEGSSLEETNKNLDELVSLAETLMEQTGIKLLWATCNLFANARYMNGAATNPDAHVVAYAGAQVKKGLEVAKRLNAENFVFWGGREGYQSLLNTDVFGELSNMANFFKMAVDAMTVIGFLKHFELDKEFKINVEPNHTTLAGHVYEHDIVMASAFGMLGSIDSNTGSPDCGWDTDQFPMDIRSCTAVMRTVIEQGGIQPGGLNFDCKVRRESTDPADIFIAHIGAMDSFARGLKNAARIAEDGILDRNLKARYLSFKTGLGAEIKNGTGSLEECEKYVAENGEPQKRSAKQEHFEAIFNHYV